MSSPRGTGEPSLLGVLGEPLALVSPGLVAMAGGGWRWRWWVAAGDRWYRPEEEVAVRVSSAEGTPVIQTSLRVPGGDVRVVCFAAVTDGGAAVVSEIHNDSAGPVLFALVSEAASTIGGRSRRFRNHRRALPPTLLRSSREADEVLFAPTVGSLVRLLDERLAGPGGTQPGPDSDPGGAHAVGVSAQLFALSVGAGLRAVASGTRSAEPPGWMASVPTAAAVAAGWRHQVDQASRLDSPDEAATSQLLADRCHLLIAAGSDTVVVRGLAAWGHSVAIECLDTALSRLEAPVDPAVADTLLHAALDVVAWSEDPARLARALAEPAAELARWVGPEPARQQAERLAAHLAAAVNSSWQPWPPPSPLVRKGPAAGPPEAVVGGSKGWAGPEMAAARRLLTRRAELLEEPAIGQLSLLPGWRDGWGGQPMELHRLPTHLGPLSLALRWHGSRPALLWHIDQRPGTGAGENPEPVLRCPVLAPAFTGQGWQGEALLP